MVLHVLLFIYFTDEGDLHLADNRTVSEGEVDQEVLVTRFDTILDSHDLDFVVTGEQADNSLNLTEGACAFRSKDVGDAKR